MLVALQNGDSSDKNVVFVHTKKVSIETEGKLNWALDGEKAESVGRVEIENLNKAISIML
jgi:diacylglycerol kinase family enzyme